MSKQIAVRLSNEIVQFIDGLVAAGRASSRAAVVTRALEHERRRELATRDAAILAEQKQGDDFDDLAEFAAHTPIDDLD